MPAVPAGQACLVPRSDPAARLLMSIARRRTQHESGRDEADEAFASFAPLVLLLCWLTQYTIWTRAGNGGWNKPGQQTSAHGAGKSVRRSTNPPLSSANTVQTFHTLLLASRLQRNRAHTCLGSRRHALPPHAKREPTQLRAPTRHTGAYEQRHPLSFTARGHATVPEITLPSTSAERPPRNAIHSQPPAPCHKPATSPLPIQKPQTSAHQPHTRTQREKRTTRNETNESPADRLPFTSLCPSNPPVGLPCGSVHHTEPE